MALTTYAELQSSIADFLNREDLASVIPTFIDLAEAQINRDVRHYQMETVATLSIEGRYTLRPINWVETVSITLDGGSANNLELLSTSAMNERRSNSGNTAGSPRYYKNTGQDIEVWPSPDQAESAPTNWLLSAAPDVYLYGSLLQSAPYLANDERIGVWAQLYSAAVLRLNEESESAKYSGSGLGMRVKGLDTGRSANYWRDR